MTIHELVKLLQTKAIYFTLATHRTDAIMATAVLPGELWEIEIFPNGSVEMEIFRSDGKIHDESMLSKKILDITD